MTVAALPITVLIVTYNSEKWIGRCLRAVEKAADELSDVQVIIVDNASGDQTCAEVKAFPGVELIARAENGGFSCGVNTGLRRIAPGRHVLLLNPDVIVEPTVFQDIGSALLSDPLVGSIGCRLVRLDGTLDRASKRSLPRPGSALFGLTPLARIPGLRRFDRYRTPSVDEHSVAYVEAICGAFMFIRAETLAAVGEFDESYFLYIEDLDYCLRIGQKGFKILYLGSCTATHVKYSSITEANRVEANRWFCDAMLIYYERHLAAGHSPVTRAAIRSGIRLARVLKPIDRQRSRSA